MRLLIADDHRLVRSGIGHLLTDHGHTVIGEASTAAEAVRMAEELSPDAVILDISMPGGSGLSVIGDLSRMTKVIVLTMHEEPVYLYRALESGARGYVLKDAADGELTAALETVARGEVYVYPTLAAKAIPLPKRRETPATPLSRRESEVLRLLALGYMLREIAVQISVSERTVETYRLRITAKLNLSTRADMVAYAMEHGLI